jgi:hypothetical protein
MHQHIHGFDETPIVATSLGPRCAIAMSTAIIRLPIDHSDPRPSRNVSRTAVSNRDPHIRDYFQKTESTWNGETDVHLYTMSALAPKADIGTGVGSGARGVSNAAISQFLTEALTNLPIHQPP